MPLVPPKAIKGGKPRRRKRISIRPPYTARLDVTLTPEEKAEIVAAAERSGEPSVARFVVNSSLMRARGTFVLK